MVVSATNQSCKLHTSLPNAGIWSASKRTAWDSQRWFKELSSHQTILTEYLFQITFPTSALYSYVTSLSRSVLKKLEELNVCWGEVKEVLSGRQ